MKIIYGKSHCVLQGASQTKDIVIKYRGNPYLIHSHLEFISIINENQASVKNLNSQSVLLHGNKQIHIGYKIPQDGELELFRYTGYFKILTAKSGGENITIETDSIDLCQLINSKFDNMGKPEQYKNTYQTGRGLSTEPKIGIPKHLRKKMKFIGKRMKSASRKSITTTRTGGY